MNIDRGTDLSNDKIQKSYYPYPTHPVDILISTFNLSMK